MFSRLCYVRVAKQLRLALAGCYPRVISTGPVASVEDASGGAKDQMNERQCLLNLVT